MSLKIIYGRSGTGKTTLCLNEIKNNIKNFEKLFLITPEQFSFNAEKSLLEILDEHAFLNAEVLTFKRMAYRVLAKNNDSERNELSKSAKAMLVYYIMQKNKDMLMLLSNNNSQDGNTDIAIRTITEFKRHGITALDLEKFENDEEDKYLKNKIKELKFIFSKYEEAIASKGIDTDDNLTYLANELEKDNSFLHNTSVWIDEFTGFTKQEYLIIEKLIKTCDNVTISICSDSLNVNEELKESDVFYTSKKTIEKIMEIAKKNKVSIETKYLNEVFRFKNDELKLIEENLFFGNKLNYKKQTENVSLYLAQDPYSEIEYVAKNISNLVSKEGLKFRDISVITKSQDTYLNLIKVIFREYNIPVFMDLEEELSANVIVKYIMYLFDILITNWSYESVFGYLKTGFTNIDSEDINKIENYVLKWGIKGSTYYKDDWKYGENKEEEEYLLTINSIRKSLIAPILKFKNSFEKSKTVKDITTSLYNFLIDENVFEKLNNRIEFLKENQNMQIANEYSLVWNNLMQIFDDIVLMIGDEKIDFIKYKNILKYGINQNKITTIPATINQVVVGDVSRSRSAKVRAVFIIGLIDKDFPAVSNDEGFLNDEDRLNFKNYGLELGKDTKEQLYEEEYNIYKAFTTAQEKLFLSFPTASNSGDSLRPSTYIHRLKRSFPNLKETSFIEKQNEIIITTKEATFNEMLENLRKWKDGETIDNEWFNILEFFKNDLEFKNKTINALKGFEYSNEVEKLDPKAIELMYGNEIKTSISRLETYNSCAFSYYLKYGLNLVPREEFTIENVDIGTFMHNVIDLFFEYAEENRIDVKALQEKEVYDIVEKIIEQVLNTKNGSMFSIKAKYVTLSIRLKKNVSSAIWIIVSELKNSEFNVLGHEMEFGKSKDLPAIVLNLDSGKKAELTR